MNCPYKKPKSNRADPFVMALYNRFIQQQEHRNKMFSAILWDEIEMFERQCPYRKYKVARTMRFKRYEQSS